MSFISELRRRNVLRVAIAYLAGAWLLIQILETLFPIFGLPETSIRIVVVILAIGFPPVLVLSWIFEWTPEGLKRDDGAVTEADAIARRRLDRIIVVVLVLALGYFAVDKFVLDPGRDAAQIARARQEGRVEAVLGQYEDKSIAVLPFVNLSPDPDQEYFADGLSEELLNLLAKVGELRVISRSSAFQYRGDDIHVPTVAEELNVSYVLEGSVRKAGDRIRITVQLIDARADAHLWSENYDREFSDVFAIQDDIARSIVDELQLELLGEAPKAERTDPETYALYLQAHHARYVLQDYSEGTEDLLKQVLERDPNYVPALNLMVEVVYLLTGDDPGDKYTINEGISLMQAYVDRALVIDPENSHAFAHRGWMAFFYRNDLETAASYLNRALEYDPANLSALFSASVVSGQIGRYEDAIALGEGALARDPLCSPCLWVLSRLYLRAGRFDQAQAAAERRMRVAPGGWITLGESYLLRGDAQKALECYGNQKSPRSGWLTASAIAHYELGDMVAHDAALSELKEIDEAGVYGDVAKVHAWAGDADAAFEWLDRHFDPAARNSIEKYARVIWNPFFRNLHDDPRWLELREEAGLSPERLTAIRIEVPEFEDAEHR